MSVSWVSDGEDIVFVLEEEVESELFGVLCGGRGAVIIVGGVVGVVGICRRYS